MITSRAMPGTQAPSHLYRTIGKIAPCTCKLFSSAVQWRSWFLSPKKLLWESYLITFLCNKSSHWKQTASFCHIISKDGTPRLGLADRIRLAPGWVVCQGLLRLFSSKATWRLYFLRPLLETLFPWHISFTLELLRKCSPRNEWGRKDKQGAS